MIVKAHRDGEYYVADNGNWRLAGPFKSNDEAWAWIDQHPSSHAEEPKNPETPRMHIRQKRTETSVSKEDVLRVVPVILRSEQSTVKEREFALRMELRAKRKRELRLTPTQAGWWKRIQSKFEVA